MSHRSFALAGLLVACVPEQPDATRGCDSLAECPLDEVCDRDTGECIPEPANRFLGQFRCTVGSAMAGSENLEPSEVTGRIGTNRWALPGAICYLDGTRLVLGFASLFSRANLRVQVDLSVPLTRATLGPAVDDGLDSAGMENFDTFTAYGYSQAGKVEFSRVPAAGQEIRGYLDVAMYPVVTNADALPGEPCPRGLADCGKKTLDAGGIALCTNLLNGDMCTRVCTNDGECAVGDGVCVLGVCTKPCTTDQDCTAPLRCLTGDAGEPNGCF